MKELEIYIHIPFCIKKCAYCDFLSGPSSAGEREKYVELLCKEIRLAKEKTKDYTVSTVFFGGGTPSILTADQMMRIMTAVKDTFKIESDAEISMEMNPGTVSGDKLNGYKAAGINRLSIGLQSTDNTELKNLGRIHTFEEFLESYRAARNAGFDNINVDLMSAIPGQNLLSWETSLRCIMELEPEHISAYSLIVEPGTPFYDRYGEEKTDPSIPSLPEEEEERQMYYVTKQMMKEHGYHRYEISNYAKDGYECRHNKGYWRRIPYLGFGVGAATLFEHTRYSNPSDVDEYKECFMEKYHGEELTLKEEMEEFMFLGLRMMEGISKTEFKKAFDREYDEVYAEVTERFLKEGFLKSEGDRIALTDKGIDVSNMIFVEFM